MQNPTPLLSRLSSMVALTLMLAFTAACGETDSPVKTGENTNMGTNTNNNGTSCKSTCVQGETTCLNSGSFLVCELQSDGCYKATNPTRCEGSKVCRAGECVEDTGVCTSTCDRSDGPRCNARGQVEECDDHNNDGCLTYDDATRCDEGLVCTKGKCESAQCGSDACEVGKTQCDGKLLQTCRTIEGCPVFSGGKECEPGNVCQDGECKEDATSACEPECAVGEILCVNGDKTKFLKCEDSDGKGCGKYTEPTACDSGQECANVPGEGAKCTAPLACKPTPCAEEIKGCDGPLLKECVKDNQGCLEENVLEDCDAAGEVCDDTGATPSCRPPKTQGVVVINEVFYNPIDDDVDASGESDMFIELAGPAGLDITGYEIQLINGSSSGNTYGSFMLPMNAKLNSDGLAVISMDKPTGRMRFFVQPLYSIITPYANGQDGLQNGPDNVVLFDNNGTKLDAMGYGAFGMNNTFAGEGMPAPTVLPGHSLGRAPGASDTNNNMADFVSYFPTPGLPNADLVINEVYVDQPGPDEVLGKMNTFIELSTPYYSFLDLDLKGYVIRAINGSDGKDYIFVDSTPGVELSGTKLSDQDSTYATLCHLDGASSTLLAQCSAAYNQKGGTGKPEDFQNGPDSIVLEYNGRVIDAVGYGTFGSGTTFKGEGTPVGLKPSNSGKSLSRRPVSDFSQPRDTNDNAKDFRLTAPTPGALNGAPTP